MALVAFRVPNGFLIRRTIDNNESVCRGDPVPGERIIVIHHAGGEVQQVSRAFCKVELSEPTSRPVIEHSCTTRPGSSGAVLIAETDHAIVGLHTSTVQNADRSPGFATRATAIPALRRIAGKP